MSFEIKTIFFSKRMQKKIKRKSSCAKFEKVNAAPHFVSSNSAKSVVGSS